MEIDKNELTVDRGELTTMDGAKCTTAARNIESRTNARISLVCCYDGVLKDDGHTSIYVGGKRRMKNVNGNITYEELVEKMYEVINMAREEIKLTLKYSFPIGEQSVAIDIGNDEDVHEMFVGNCIRQSIIVYIVKSTNEDKTGKGHKSTSKNIGPSSASHAFKTSCAQERKDPDINGRRPIFRRRFPRKEDSPQSVEDISLSTHGDRRQGCMFPFCVREEDLEASEACPSISTTTPLTSRNDEGAQNDMNNLGGDNGSDSHEDFGSDSNEDGMDKKDGLTCERHHDVPTHEWQNDVPTCEQHEDNIILEEEVLHNDAGRKGAPSMNFGKLFASKGDFQNALKEFAIVSNFEYEPIATRATKVVAKCSIRSCSWRIRASKLRGDSTFKIISHTSHTCRAAERGQDHRQATSRWIASRIKGLLKLHPDYNPDKIISYIQKEYDVVVSYRKAWHAKKIAMTDITSGWEDSYKLLPRYCEELKLVDPEAKFQLVCEKDNTFLRFFWAFGPSICSYRTLRPIVSIDKTSLRGKYGGELLMAQAVDGNNEGFPLAFAVVEKENNQTREWFLRLLGDHVIGYDSKLVIISDRHDSIKEYVPQVFPNALHSYCVFHLSKNFHTKFNNAYVTELIWRLAREFTVQGYEAEMQAVKNMNPAYHAWLDNVGVEHWTSAHFPGKRYGVMTTDYSEGMNSLLLLASTLPMTSIVERTRAKVSSYFYQRALDGAASTYKLTKYAEDHLKEEMDHSRFLLVSPCSQNEFAIIDGDKTHAVNLKTRSCSCRSFDILGLPCRHACAAITRQNLSAYDYCEEWYSADRYRGTYNEVMHPMVDERQWKGRDDTEVVKPPHSRNRAGRPQKFGIKSASEKGNAYRCSMCKKKGHNSRTCKPSPKRRKNGAGASNQEIEQL